MPNKHCHKVIMKLTGGLGNQMFQYACGRAMAAQQKSTLILDTSFFDHQTLRRFELDDFAIQAELVAPTQAAEIKGSGIIRRLANGITGRASLKRVREKTFCFDPSILAQRGTLHLDGYWQSEKYFADITDAIRSEFRLKSKRASLTEMARRILAVNAVSVHVRRGDYVENPTTNEFHGLCSPAYYEQAISYIKTQVPAENIHVFVFSDDPTWSRASLTLDLPSTVVSDGNLSPAEEIHLMSLCRHHVIANSTFSWWGAWLNERVDKIVIAPRRWFNNPDIDTSDLIPETWTRV